MTKSNCFVCALLISLVNYQNIRDLTKENQALREVYMLITVFSSSFLVIFVCLKRTSAISLAVSSISIPALTIPSITALAERPSGSASLCR